LITPVSIKKKMQPKIVYCLHIAIKPIAIEPSRADASRKSKKIVG
jgi:hypothetical protein